MAEGRQTLASGDRESRGPAGFSKSRSQWLIRSETRAGSRDVRHGTGQVSTDSVESGRAHQRACPQAGHNCARLHLAVTESKKFAPMEHWSGYIRPYVP